MRPPRQLLWAQLPAGSNDTAATHGSNNASTNNATSNPWGPFGNAATYGTDMAIVVGILLSGFLLGVLLMFGVRYCLRRRRGAARDPAAGEADDADQKAARGGGEERPSEPPTVYAAGQTQMTGAAAECAICLTDFEDGDALRLLPACRHGFHVECVERWLASAAGSSRHPASRKAPPPSCPVCRSRCLPPESEPEPAPAPEP